MTKVKLTETENLCDSIKLKKKKNALSGIINWHVHKWQGPDDCRGYYFAVFLGFFITLITFISIGGLRGWIFLSSLFKIN